MRTSRVMARGWATSTIVHRNDGGLPGRGDEANFIKCLLFRAIAGASKMVEAERCRGNSEFHSALWREHLFLRFRRRRRRRGPVGIGAGGRMARKRRLRSAASRNSNRG